MHNVLIYVQPIWTQILHNMLKVSFTYNETFMMKICMCNIFFNIDNENMCYKHTQARSCNRPTHEACALSACSIFRTSTVHIITHNTLTQVTLIYIYKWIRAITFIRCRHRHYNVACAHDQITQRASHILRPCFKFSNSPQLNISRAEYFLCVIVYTYTFVYSLLGLPVSYTPIVYKFSVYSAYY